jgi:hypothetical protein
MRNVRLLVPDQLHAKMHKLCSLAGISVATGYTTFAALLMDTTTENDAVKHLRKYAYLAVQDEDPVVVREALAVEV